MSDYTYDECMDLAQMCAQVAEAYRLPVARSWHPTLMIRQEIRAYQDAVAKWTQQAQKLKQGEA